MNADKLNYLYAKETKRFSDWVNRKYLEISDIQSPRVLNHWEKNNIIPISGSYKKHTRRIYSLIDLLWLLILKELREFGVPLQSLYGIKHWISTFPANKELPDLPKEYYKVINERVSNSTNYNLEFAFYHCFVERKLAYLVTNSLGEGRVLSHTDLMLEVNNMVVANMVIINIHKIVQALFPKRDISPGPKKQLTKMDSDLFMLMVELYESEASNIELKLKDGGIEQIKISNYEDVDSAIEILAKKDDYQEITVSIEKGKKQYIKRIKKLKL